MDDETKKKIKEVQQENNYPGLERLVRAVGRKYKDITRGDVKAFLSKDLPAQLYATQQKINSKGHIVAFIKDELWQMDISVMRSSIAEFNDGYKYIFACVDVFTRKHSHRR